MRRTRTIKLTLAAIVLGGFSSQLLAANLSVPQQFRTLDHAIQNAQDGDTIFLSPGEYWEDFEIVNKVISIKGTGLNTTDTKIVNTKSPHLIRGTRYKETSVSFENLTFTSGIKGGQGGITAESCTVDFTDCDFRNIDYTSTRWTSQAYGGAFRMSFGSASFDHCRFDSNQAHAWNRYAYQFAAADGGAIYTYNSDLLVYNSTFVDNEVWAQLSSDSDAYAWASGGAIMAVDSNVDIQQSTFSGNRVVSEDLTGNAAFVVGRGGAICVDYLWDKIENPLFVKNTIEGNRVSTNRFGVNEGGGIYLKLDKHCTAYLDSLLMAKNHADKGGALFVYDSNVKMTFCDFICNTHGHVVGGNRIEEGNRYEDCDEPQPAPEPQPEPEPQPDDNLCPGDLNGDGLVNRNDMQLLNRLIREGRYEPEADFDGDGRITRDDADLLRELFGVCP